MQVCIVDVDAYASTFLTVRVITTMYTAQFAAVGTVPILGIFDIYIATEGFLFRTARNVTFRFSPVITHPGPIQFRLGH